VHGERYDGGRRGLRNAGLPRQPSLQLGYAPAAAGGYDRADGRRIVLMAAALIASATLVSGSGPGSGQQQVGKTLAAERR
jgi:hypothetical protein